MTYLLDTVVISEVKKDPPLKRVIDFLGHAQPGELFLSVITIGEIANGIELMPIGARRMAYESWFAEMKQVFGHRILSVDDVIGERWGALAAQVKQSGGQVDVPDGLIAATALVHDLAVVTRNVKDFEGTGVRTVNPWDDAS